MTKTIRTGPILIVENDEETRRVYSDALIPLQLKVVEAGNSYEAFDQLRKHSPAVILTDLRMPGGGVEYLTNLRRVDPDIPIVAVTGFGGQAVREAVLAAGATVFLEKPISNRQLRETVAQFLAPPQS